VKLPVPDNAWWWRAAAIALAVAGVIDPGFPALRRAQPELAIVAAEPRDTLLARQIARELQSDFTVVSGPFAAAAATVIAGARLPDRMDELAAPVFAVLPEQSRTRVSLEALQAPGRVPLDARVPVEVTANVRGGRGRALEITLQAGSATVDRVTSNVSSDAARLRVPLSFVPTATGSLPLRITAQLAGAAPPAVAELDVSVHDAPWDVLFFDTRPSWLSTFVRRAVQSDGRFAVTSRVVTSRSISTDAGGPPATLSDLAALKRYSLIVVGAPAALTARDVAGLEGFLRRRGGAVVFLFDQPARGPFEELTQVVNWSRATSRTAVPVVATVGDGESLKASDVLWPAQLPAQARALARDPAQRPVIWQSAVGAGQLIVSGALDAWRYRDAAVSSFPNFWQTLLAEAAEAAPPAIDIVAASRIEPGADLDVKMWLREAALATDGSIPVRATVSATLEKPDGRDVMRLWPDGPAGRMRAFLRAPATPGRYRVVVTSDGQRAERPIIVARNIARPEPSEHDLLRSWVVAHQGNAFDADELGQLAAALDRTIQPPARKQMTYPMRSAWWILPFALVLAAEWWMRRRRGLP
jgi:hypothetical protein